VVFLLYREIAAGTGDTGLVVHRASFLVAAGWVDKGLAGDRVPILVAAGVDMHMHLVVHKVSIPEVIDWVGMHLVDNKGLAEVDNYSLYVCLSLG